jgi:hypothetical protein
MIKINRINPEVHLIEVKYGKAWYQTSQLLGSAGLELVKISGRKKS